MSMLLVTTAQPYNLVTLSVPCLLLSYDNFSILFIIFVCMGVCLHIRLWVMGKSGVLRDQKKASDLLQLKSQFWAALLVLRTETNNLKE